MKLLDIVKEELLPVTDKDKKEVKLVYKALQTGIYRPYRDVNKLKYILPDFEDHFIFPSLFNDQVLIYLDFGKVKMYMISSSGKEVEVGTEGDDAIVRNITNKIISKFKQHNIVVKDYFNN